jgi:uncharacterized protein (DUF58 family)
MGAFWFAIIVGLFALVQMQFFFFIGLRKIYYRRYFNKTSVFEGDSAEMVEILENRKLAPVPWLRVESSISPYLCFKKSDDVDIRHDQFHKSIFYLRGYKRIRRRHSFTCTHRGFYKLSTTSLTTGDLFGMFNKFVRIPGDSYLYVYPKPLSHGEISPEALKWQGDIMMKRWILPDPILVNGIREYLPGDSQKDIHWGATARTGQLQVKVRDHTVSPRLFLIVNTQISETLWSNMEPEEAEVIETGIRYAAHLASWATSNGLEVGFASNGRLVDSEGIVRLDPACSQANLEMLLQAMAKLEIVRELNFHTLLDYMYRDALTGMDFAIISPYWSDTIEKRANRLRSLGNSITYIPVKPHLSKTEVSGYDAEPAV